jgi:hypothetical protein
VKALSLRQPWAHAVLHGKNIENRRWNTSFRGDFLIHAAKGCTEAEYDDALIWVAMSAKSNMTFPDWKDLQRGGIVGAAYLYDVISPGTEPIMPPSKADLRWWMREQYGFVLTDIRPSPVLLPCKGALGFWDVPDSVVEALKASAA